MSRLLRLLKNDPNGVSNGQGTRTLRTTAKAIA